MKTGTSKRSIFLSYARADDEAFASRLNAELTALGFDVWWDRTRMPSRGMTFLAEIKDAINTYERFLLVLGPSAVTSEYVVAEWQHAIAVGKPVTVVLRLGDFASSPSELKSLHAQDFRDDATFNLNVNHLVRQLSDPIPLLGKLIGVPRLPRHLLARPEAASALRDVVLADLVRPTTLSGALAVTGISGMPGIGKSVLANALSRDPATRRAFPDGIVWLTMGRQADLLALQRRLAAAFIDDRFHCADISQGRGHLCKILGDKQALIVLDDVWERHQADAFDVLGPRGRLVITTRNAGLVTSLGGEHYQVQLPTESEARRILAVAACIDIDALPDEAHAIVAACDRLPLALALCGGMVVRGLAWSEVARRLHDAALEHIADRHAASPLHRNLWTAIDVSVTALPGSELARYRELALFVHEGGIPVEAIRTLWAHTGRLNAYSADDLLLDFVDRSLVRFDDSKRKVDGTPRRSVWVHDLLRAYLSRVAADSAAAHRRLLAAYRMACDAGWSNGPDDGYFHHHLLHHLLKSAREADAIGLLFDARWLLAKLRLVPEGGIERDCQLAISHWNSKLDAPRREFMQFLREFVAPLQVPELLPTLLWGHFAGTRNRAIAKLLSQVCDVATKPWLRPQTDSMAAARTGLLRSIRAGGRIKSLAVGDTAEGVPIVVAVSDWSPKALQVWLGEMPAGRAPVPDDQTLTALNLPSDRRPAILHTWSGQLGGRQCRLYDLSTITRAEIASLPLLTAQPDGSEQSSASLAMGPVIALGDADFGCVGRAAGGLMLLATIKPTAPVLRLHGDELTLFDASLTAGDGPIRQECLDLWAMSVREEAGGAGFTARLRRLARELSELRGEEITVDTSSARERSIAAWDVSTGQLVPRLAWEANSGGKPVLLGETLDGVAFVIVEKAMAAAELWREGSRGRRRLPSMSFADRPVMARWKGRPAIVKGGLGGLEIVDAVTAENVGRFNKHLDEETLIASIDDEQGSWVASVGRLGSRGRFSTSVRIWDTDSQVQVRPTGDVHTEEITAVTAGRYRGESVFATGSFDLVCIWPARRLSGYSPEREPETIQDPNECGRVKLGQLPKGYRHHDLGSVLPQLPPPFLGRMFLGVSTRAACRSDEDSLIATRQVWKFGPPEADGWRHGTATPAVTTGRGSDVTGVTIRHEEKRYATIVTTRRDGTVREWLLMPRADEERQLANWLYWHCVAIKGPMADGTQIDVRVDPMSGSATIRFEHHGAWVSVEFDGGVPATQCALGEHGRSIVIFDERGGAHHLDLMRPEISPQL